MKDEDILALANGIAVTSVFSSTIIYRVHLAETDSQEKARAEADAVRRLLTEYLTLRSGTLAAEAKVADTADMLEHAKENIAGWRRAFGTTTPDGAVRRFRDAEAKVARLDEVARSLAAINPLRDFTFGAGEMRTNEARWMVECAVCCVAVPRKHEDDARRPRDFDHDDDCARVAAHAAVATPADPAPTSAKETK